MKRLVALLGVACSVPLPSRLAVGEVAAVAEPPAPDLVDVAVPRELRGLWVATVSNLDFPSRQGLTPDEMRSELGTLVDRSADLGLNALVFQVRPEGDALYRSELEPWSRFLTGRQGRDPGFDPLEFLVDAAHARGLQVHAWFNPYRASASRSAPNADNHVSRWARSHTRPWGRLLWLDPGVPEVRDHALSVISDVASRYDVDGVHLDDYFYPYPEGQKAFPDDPSYKAYVAQGGTLDRDAWRRDNVDRLVSGLAGALNQHKPEVTFGISPFGIYRPGFPEGVRGLDQVRSLHADPLKWYDQGWVDYLAPQLYWPTTQKAQRYDRLLDWWNTQMALERPLLVGLDLTRVGKDPAWTLSEVRSQVTLAREADHAAGQIWFRATPVLKNQAGLADLLGELYAEPALPPPVSRLLGADAPAPPLVAASAGRVSIEAPDRDALRALVLYRETAEGLRAERILGPGTGHLALEPGTWALSAVVRSGAESPGVRFRVPADDDGVSAAPAR